jgi:hypothetical protein
MPNTTIYLPDDSKTKELLKRVEVYRETHEKVLQHKPSFSECVIRGLEKLVEVEK